MNKNIREFINNDLPKEKQFVPDYTKKKPHKNVVNDSTFNRSLSKNGSTVKDKNQYNDLKSITELSSEKNMKLTENTPKNYIISPKDGNFQNFEFTQGGIGINSLKTPNSDEIDRKMNFFDSGDQQKKVKIQTLKSLDSEFLSINDKNFHEFSSNFAKENNQIDEKVKLMELKQKVNNYKEKFKNLELNNNNQDNNSNQKLNISYKSSENNEKNEKVTHKLKKSNETNIISFKQNLNIKSSKSSEEAVKQRILEITQTNAVLKIQGFVRWVKHFKEHPSEFQEENNEENEENDEMSYNPNNASDRQDYNNKNRYNLNQSEEIKDQYLNTNEEKKQDESASRNFESEEGNNQNDQRNIYQGESNNVSEEIRYKNYDKSHKEKSNSASDERYNNYSDDNEVFNKSVNSKDVDSRNNNSIRIQENISVDNKTDRSNSVKQEDKSKGEIINESNVSDNFRKNNSRKGSSESQKNVQNNLIVQNNNNNQINPSANRNLQYEQQEVSNINSSFKSDYSRKCYSAQRMRDNSTIILSPNSMDSPRLHNIQNLIKRQINESHEERDSIDQGMSKSDVYNDSYANEEVNNTSDFKNIDNNNNSFNNSNKMVLKSKKDGKVAPKLNLLDLGKKSKRSRSETSENNENVDISINSSSAKNNIINRSNDKLNQISHGSNNSNNPNNFKLNKNLKNSPKEIQSNDNINVLSNEVIENFNINNLISSQESILSRKLDDDIILKSSKISEKDLLVGLNQTKKIVDEEKNYLGSSQGSNTSIKGLVKSPQLKEDNNSNKSKEDLNIAENKSFESKYTFKNDDYKRNNVDVEKNEKFSLASSHDSKLSLTLKDLNKDLPSQNFISCLKQSNVEIEQEPLTDEIRQTSKEERRSMQESQSRVKNRNEDNNNIDQFSSNQDDISSKRIIVDANNQRNNQRFEHNLTDNDIEADKDVNNMVDWQFSLNTDKTLEKDVNTLSSNRSEKNKVDIYEEKNEIDDNLLYKEAAPNKTQEVKENHSVNPNNSYNDFEYGENFGDGDENNDNFDEILNDKVANDSIHKLGQSDDHNLKKGAEIKSDREDMFKIENDDTNLRLSNLLDDVKSNSNSELNTLSPHLIPSEMRDNNNTISKMINSRYQDYIESDRDKTITERKNDVLLVEKKIEKEIILSDEDMRLADEITESLINQLVKETMESLIPKKKNIILNNNANNSVNQSYASNTSETSRGMFIFNPRFIDVL